MLQNPKEFYRKLDKFLSEIYLIGADNVLSVVLKELVLFLGRDLRIQNGRLYELELDHFRLIETVNLDNGSGVKKTLPLNNEAVQLIIKNGSYIFNDPNLSQLIATKVWGDQLTPVAFVIQKDDRMWLFIFELQRDWDREEIDFSINTIRKALNARMSSELFQNYLHQAEHIQRSLLPKEPPEIPGFDIAGKSIAADIVGGDLYDFIVFDDSTFGVAIGDASGHGLPAALLVRDVVTGLRMGLEKDLKLTPTLEKLNRVIHRSTLSTSFISLFYGEIETNGNLVYTNAGHPPPILISGLNVQTLDQGGFVLGPLPQVKLKRGFAILNPGSSLILYSDGLIERLNPFGEPFELERLTKVVLEFQQLSANKLVNKIIDTAYEFGGRGRWLDDVTVVVVKRLI